ncbi:MAG: acetylxylan esterase [Victivallaceae bacterium]|nr:acetylxylan esterase [Victivallaceae bacterium]
MKCLLTLFSGLAALCAAAVTEITVGDDLTVNVTDGGTPAKAVVRVSEYNESAAAPIVRVTERETPFKLTPAVDRPGFVLWIMETPDGKENKTIDKRFGFANRPDKIVRSSERPADFDAFWDAQLKRLAAVPVKVLEMKEVPVEDKNYAEKMVCYDVKIACVDNVPVSGFLVMPRHAAPKSLPAVVTYQGAGVYSAGKMFRIAEAGAMVLDINAHGIENGRPGEFYANLEKNELSGYFLRGINDRNKCYFLNMFLRVRRSLDFMKTLPEWDGRNLFVGGGSQGGLQSVVAAALDPDVTFAAPQAPWLCNIAAVLEKRNYPSWPGFIKAGNNGAAADPAVADAMRYFDAVNFAGRVKCEVFVTCGLLDSTCPPSGIFMMYNELAGKNRSWKIFDGETHAGPGLYHAGTEALIAKIKTVSGK